MGLSRSQIILSVILASACAFIFCASLFIEVSDIKKMFNTKSKIETPPVVERNKDVLSVENETEQPRKIESPSVKVSKRNGDIYTCEKDGKKLITDIPCDQMVSVTKNADKNQHVEALARLETDKKLLNQKRQERRTREAREGTSKYQLVSAVEQQEAECRTLQKEKESIKVAQRQNSNDYWNDRSRRVDNRMYELKCGF